MTSRATRHGSPTVTPSIRTSRASSPWQRLERGDDPPHAYAVESTRSKADAIAKAQAQGRVSSRFDARVLLGLIIHFAAFWATSNPDVLAVMNTPGAKPRRQIIQDAVATLVA